MTEENEAERRLSGSFPLGSSHSLIYFREKLQNIAMFFISLLDARRCGLHRQILPSPHLSFLFASQPSLTACLFLLTTAKASSEPKPTQLSSLFMDKSL